VSLVDRFKLFAKAITPILVGLAIGIAWGISLRVEYNRGVRDGAVATVKAYEASVSAHERGE
jgi:hypothetical protein